jgi:hypothetical protein
MATTKTKARAKREVVPAAPRLSMQEEYDRDYAAWEPSVARSLNWRCEHGQKAREELLTKIGAGMPGELARQIAWSENIVKADYEWAHAAGVLIYYEEDPSDGQPIPKRERLIRALRHYAEDFTRRLVRDHLRANSTGAFHRAAESTERAAIASSLEAFAAYVREFDEIEERGRKLAGQ